MPKLTQVKETKRGRYALFFDGEFAFSLDEDTFAMAGLHTGDELEEWQIHDLQTKSDTRKAVDKAMDLLALRDHAAGELYQKLCRSFDPHSAAAAVAKMQELNLLDDAGFARAVRRSCCVSARAAVQFWMICTPKALTAARPPKRWKLCLPKARRTRRKTRSWPMPAHWWNATMPQSWHRANGSR